MEKEKRLMLLTVLIAPLLIWVICGFIVFSHSLVGFPLTVLVIFVVWLLATIKINKKKDSKVWKNPTLQDAEKLVQDIKNLGFEFDYNIEQICEIEPTFIINHNNKEMEDDEVFIDFVDDYIGYFVDNNVTPAISFYYDEDWEVI